MPNAVATRLRAEDQEERKEDADELVTDGGDILVGAHVERHNREAHAQADLRQHERHDRAFQSEDDCAELEEEGEEGRLLTAVVSDRFDRLACCGVGQVNSGQPRGRAEPAGQSNRDGLEIWRMLRGT